MSLIKWSGLVSEVVGKLNGSVFFRNRYGSVIRNNTTPINNHTPADEIIRAYIYYLSKHWKDLTEIQRAAWRTLATRVTLTNPFGDTYNPTGYNLYISNNMNLKCAGLAFIDDAPDHDSPHLFPAFSIIEDIPHSELLIDSATGGMYPDTYWIVFASAGISEGILYAENKYRIIEVLSPSFPPLPNLFASYVSKFGVPGPNKRIFFKVKPVHYTSGFSGIETRNFCDVTNYPGLGSMAIGSTFIVY
jgi:hypothetical protein